MWRRNAGVTEHSRQCRPSLQPGSPKPLGSHCSSPPSSSCPRGVELRWGLERRCLRLDPPEGRAHGVLSVTTALLNGQGASGWPAPQSLCAAFAKKASVETSPNGLQNSSGSLELGACHGTSSYQRAEDHQGPQPLLSAQKGQGLLSRVRQGSAGPLGPRAGHGPQQAEAGQTEQGGAAHGQAQDTAGSGGA